MNNNLQDRINISGETGVLDLSGLKVPSSEIARLLVDTSAKEINLTGNNIRNGIDEIAKSLENSLSVQVLNLNTNWIGDIGAISVAKLLTTNMQLRVLKLGLNYIGKDGAVEIARSLETNTSLHVLNLNFNSIGSAGASEIASSLINNTSLNMLTLSCNNIGTAAVIRLARSLTKNTTLQSLDIYGNNIEEGGIVEIAKLLKVNHTLTELGLGNNNIRLKSAILLAQTLYKNSSLRILKLNDNDIGSEAAIEIVSALTINVTLETLNLASNNINSIAATEIARMLTINTSLKELNLFCNPIECNFYLILDALNINSSLQVLDVRGIGMNEKDITQISKLLSTNTALQELKLSIAVGMDEYVPLVKILIESTVLQKLCFDSGCLSDQISANLRDEIADIAESNYTLTEIKGQFVNDRIKQVMIRNKQMREEKRFMTTKVAI